MTRDCDKHDLSTLAGSQTFILAHKGRLSGSRANGTATSSSDWDYYLRESAVHGHLRAALQEQSIAWDSPFLGSITWWPEGIQIETSYLFPRRSPRRTK